MAERKVGLVWVVVIAVVGFIGGSWVTQVYMTPGMSAEQRLNLRSVTQACTDEMNVVRQDCVYTKKRMRFDQQ
ncbi:MAG: hypothetical protein CML22_07300 [Rheinheimera sp.]|nr:hypothetical protein [Rheinheimera sp.]MBM34090.1 hypothetical protein [Rheinheimera sp.]|tara:strand:- start:19765 stop:19983 length:219 start_codon:yes stop_codon:yes gene_type:complete